MQILKYYDKKRKGWMYRFDLTINGKRFRHGGFRQKRDAEDAAAAVHLLAQRLRYGLPPNVPDVTVGQLQTKLDKDQNVPPRVCWVFGLFVDQVGYKRTVRSLNRADIKSFADHLQKRKLADASFRLYMERLRAALNRAGDYFPDLETWKAPKFPKLPQGNRRSRTVKKAEIAAFLAVLSRPWPNDRPDTQAARLDLCDIIRLMLLLGARREEITKINVKSINREERTLMLWSSKTKKEHLIPLSPSALNILLSREEQTGKLFKRTFLTSTITRTMHRASQMIEMPFGQADAWTLHDLRRTASVTIERAGISYSAIQDVLGHSRRGATANYTPAQWDELERAVNELEKWCQDIDGALPVSTDLHRPPETSPISVAA